MSIKKHLSDLRHGDINDAFEAAKALSTSACSYVEEIIMVLNEAERVHNREAAAYALSWTRNERALEFLLSIFNNVAEHPTVRGQAIEGIALHRPTKRNRLWNQVEASILRGLTDKSVEVRFWACYAAGELRLKTALPTLRRLAATDAEICPRWWRVSEEAADAIEWIHGRETPPRLPL